MTEQQKQTPLKHLQRAQYESWLRKAEDPEWDEEKFGCHTRSKAERAAASLALELRDHLAAMAKKDEQHKCFHCGFVATTQEDGEAHFGDGDDGEPICRSWERMSKEDRIVDYQGVYKELLAERRTNESLRVSNEGLEYQVDSQKGAIQSYKPFAKCNSINDVFFVYDSMEGRALTAEESVTALQEQVRTLREAMTELRDELGTRYDGADDSRTQWMGSLIAAADAALEGK